MRVLHLSKYDARGGAALAARASVVAQRAAGIDARLHAARVLQPAEFINTPTAVESVVATARFVGERLPFRLLGIAPGDVRSLGAFGTSARALEERYRPDIVMLHAIDGLLPIEEVANFTVPVVWRLHDMWGIGGSRHYAAASDPPLRGLAGTIDRAVLRRKAAAYHRARHLYLCPPSHWLATQAALSPLTRDLGCAVVANGVDVRQFRLRDQVEARAVLGLPQDAMLFLVGASGGMDDPRKGFDLLLAAVRLADAAMAGTNAELVIFGGDRPPGLDGLQTRVHHVGPIADRDRLATLYAAGGVFVAPSRMENLSLMVLESLACGTPVMAFDIGGMPDMVRPGRTGWLLPAFDVPQFAALLRAIAKAPHDARALRDGARQVAEREFSHAAEARGMLAFYERVLREAGGAATPDR